MIPIAATRKRRRLTLSPQHRKDTAAATVVATAPYDGGSAQFCQSSVIRSSVTCRASAAAANAAMDAVRTAERAPLPTE